MYCPVSIKTISHTYLICIFRSTKALYGRSRDCVKNMLSYMYVLFREIKHVFVSWYNVFVLICTFCTRWKATPGAHIRTVTIVWKQLNKKTENTSFQGLEWHLLERRGCLLILRYSFQFICSLKKAVKVRKQLSKRSKTSHLQFKKKPTVILVLWKK